MSTFIVPSLRQSVQEVLDKALRGIETSNYELEFETKTKEIRYLLVNATTRRDAENNIIGVVGYVARIFFLSILTSSIVKTKLIFRHLQSCTGCYRIDNERSCDVCYGKRVTSAH